MHTKLSSWLSLIALLAMFTFEAAAQAPAPAAAGTPAAAASTQLLGTIKITRKVGKVTAQEIGSDNKKDLENDMVITQGHIVRTEANSSVVLMFSNGASINLAFNSELNIETFTQDPFAGNFEPSKAEDEPSVSTTNITLTKGELVGNVKKLKRGGAVESKFTVGTPVGAAGIRGTTFKITYRPLGDGRASFILTTVEGNVQLTIGSGTVNVPPVSVTNNQEVVLNNVQVNTTTNQITATTATGQTVAVTLPPPAADAPVATVAQVQAVAVQLAQAVATVVFTTPTLPAPAPQQITPTPTPAPEEKKETPPPAPTPASDEKKEAPQPPAPPPSPPVVPTVPQTTNPR